MIEGRKKSFLISKEFLDNFATYEPGTKMYRIMGDKFELVDVDGICTIKITDGSGCECEGCKREAATTKKWEE